MLLQTQVNLGSKNNIVLNMNRKKMCPSLNVLMYARVCTSKKIIKRNVT